MGKIGGCTESQSRSAAAIDLEQAGEELHDEIIDVGMTVASALVGRQGAMRETAWPNQRWKRSGLERAGWTVERSLRHGAGRGSDPSTRDERAYLLLRRT